MKTNSHKEEEFKDLTHKNIKEKLYLHKKTKLQREIPMNLLKKATKLIVHN